MENYLLATLCLKDVDNESEDMYEVEKILDKKTDKKGALYLVKWEGFSEAQATWEPEEHLQGVKWLMEDFNRRGNKQNKTDTAPQKRTAAPAAEDKPSKKPDPEPVISLPPNLIQDTDSPSFKPKSKPRQAPKVACKSPPLKVPPPTVQPTTGSPRVVRGNLSLDVAVKILGCRQQGTGIEYAVQFKRRADVMVMPQIYSHDELRSHAPWLLSQYLLEAAKVEEGRLGDTN